MYSDPQQNSQNLQKVGWSTQPPRPFAAVASLSAVVDWSAVGAECGVHDFILNYYFSVLKTRLLLTAAVETPSSLRAHYRIKLKSLQAIFGSNSPPNPNNRTPKRTHPSQRPLYRRPSPHYPFPAFFLLGFFCSHPQRRQRLHHASPAAAAAARRPLHHRRRTRCGGSRREFAYCHMLAAGWGGSCACVF